MNSLKKYKKKCWIFYLFVFTVKIKTLFWRCTREHERVNEEKHTKKKLMMLVLFAVYIGCLAECDGWRPTDRMACVNVGRARATTQCFCVYGWYVWCAFFSVRSFVRFSCGCSQFLTFIIIVVSLSRSLAALLCSRT